MKKENSSFFMHRILHNLKWKNYSRTIKIKKRPWIKKYQIIMCTEEKQGFFFQQKNKK